MTAFQSARLEGEVENTKDPVKELVYLVVKTILRQEEMEVNWHKLKGHCHAIWQLYKKLEGVFPSIEFQY